MKKIKILSAIVAAALSVSLVSCGASVKLGKYENKNAMTEEEIREAADTADNVFSADELTSVEFEKGNRAFIVANGYFQVQCSYKIEDGNITFTPDSAYELEGVSIGTMTFEEKGSDILLDGIEFAAK